MVLVDFEGRKLQTEATLNSSVVAGNKGQQRATKGKGQQRATAGKPVCVGGAGGNENIKISVDGKDFVIRSQGVPYHPEFVSNSDEIILATAIDTPVFSGAYCIGKELDKENRVETLGNGLKGKLYAKFVLIAIAHAVDNGAFIHLALSAPNKAMTESLMVLRDSHTVEVGGKRKHFLIDQIVFGPEGYGSALQLRAQRIQKDKIVPEFAVIDIGGGNWSVVALDGAGRRRGTDSIANGVRDLYTEIARAVSTESGIPPTIDEIRLGVERGTFRLNGYGDVNFESKYWEAFEPWVYSSLSELNNASRKAKQLIDRSVIKVVCGGGSLLPGMQELLSDKGFVFANNPQSIESQGLLNCARRIGQ